MAELPFFVRNLSGQLEAPMTIEWIEEPQRHTVRLELAPNERCTDKGDYVDVTVSYAENCEIVLSAEFSRRNCGRAVAVQALFGVDDKGFRRFEATARVSFIDDGSVVGYGDTSNGVRFLRKRFEIARAQRMYISAYVA